MAVSTQLANNLKIASDGAGNALAIWIDQNNTTYRLTANRYVVGRGWGTTAAIDAVDANKLQSPSIGIDGNGNAVAAWVQGDAAGSIEAARFE
jgi:hypothetical protein